ncbi:MAG: ABC transporter ATP-binding protein [Sphaerochaetaceae bacterium]|jgi:simple sugar transport system ATP-binding protein|nr:ABC transporter ATP-binding protein [Sphaerochaetaceae bacterium]
MTRLRMRNISKSFFGSYANHEVCLDVDSAEIHALLGENGAGKTTLMNILYGIYRKDGGTITIDGEEVDFKSPKEAIARSVGMVHQHFTLVPTLTVQQNITLGLKDAGYPCSRERQRCAHIARLATSYGWKIDPSALVRELSVGEMQRVEILKLLYRNARVLIFDEPTAVLTMQESAQLFEMFKLLKAQGCSIIVITHHIQEVLEHCDRVTVLRDGKSIGTERIADVDAKRLSSLMIGRDLVPVARERDRKGSGETILELAGYGFARSGTKRGSVDLSLDRSEIVGIAGVDGNGQKELLETLMGLRDHVSGNAFFKGKDISMLSTAQRRTMGISYISDDRHHDSLVLDMGAAQNMMLRPGALCETVTHHLIDRRKMHRLAAEAVESYGIKTQGISEPMRFLSGGNQQKLVLARELAGRPDLIIAFQPTRGLDIGATEFIHHTLLRMRDAGSATLLVSTNLEEILLLSDRIAVMHEGMITGIIDNDSPDIMRIGLMMAGIDCQGEKT